MPTGASKQLKFPNGSGRLKLAAVEPDHLSNDAFAEWLWANLVKYSEGTDSEKAAIEKLTPTLQAFWATQLLEYEVGNGGFVQFFWNSSREFVGEAILGYEFFGLGDYAKLVEEAVAIAKPERPLFLAAAWDGSPEAFSRLYELSRLESFDDRLFDQMGETSDLRVQYLREHLDQVVA